MEEVGQESLLEDVRWALEDADGSVALGDCLKAPMGPVYPSVLRLTGCQGAGHCSWWSVLNS